MSEDCAEEAEIRLRLIWQLMLLRKDAMQSVNARQYCANLLSQNRSYFSNSKMLFFQVACNCEIIYILISIGEDCMKFSSS